MKLLRKTATNVAVIDIRSSSVGVAYASVQSGASPTLVYSVRIPIDPHATEPLAEAVPRTLERALGQLVKEGAPLLRAATGSGRVERVLATATAPWQHSEVFSRAIEPGKPFVFTKEMLLNATRQGVAVKPGHRRVSDMIIATLLNGYEVEHPFGKRVNRVELILLASSIEEVFMDRMSRLIRKALHVSHIEFNAYLPEVFMPLRQVYPHHPDFLTLDIGGEATDVLMVKHGLLISTTCMSQGVNDMSRAARSMGLSSPAVPTVDMIRQTDPSTAVQQAQAAWLGEIHDSLAEIAKEEPLPRTVFLLTEEHVREFLRTLLDAEALRTLWLSEESLSILPVLPAQFAPHLSGLGEEGADPILALLVLAAHHRILS